MEDGKIMVIKNEQIAEFLKTHNIELGKVYTMKDMPPFKTPEQIEKEKENL